MKPDALAAGPGRPARRVAGFGDSVFARYTQLAQQHGAINLGQGYPDFDPPEFVLDALRAAAGGAQQYAPVAGVPELLAEISADFAAATGVNVDPATGVQVTVGATEALFATVHALVDPGDEVVLFEPFYDSYPANIAMAGGVPRSVPLRREGAAWAFDPEELAAAFGPRTRMIIVNTPHNPAGKVFSPQELDLIIALATRHDAVILADEVYERIAFTPHIPVASRPGAWERTVTVSSVGKTFSATGWKIGWAVAPKELIRPLRAAHQWLTYAVATPLQHAAAEAMRRARTNGYYAELEGDYRARRDLLAGLLGQTALRPLECQGSYFLLADARETGFAGARELCLALPALTGVAAIPVDEFHSPAHQAKARHLVRFAFCKTEAALREAGARLAGVKTGLSR